MSFCNGLVIGGIIGVILLFGLTVFNLGGKQDFIRMSSFEVKEFFIMRLGVNLCVSCLMVIILGVFNVLYLKLFERTIERARIMKNVTYFFVLFSSVSLLFSSIWLDI